MSNLFKLTKKKLRHCRKRVKSHKAVRQMVKMKRYKEFSSESFEKEVNDLEKQEIGEVTCSVTRLWQIALLHRIKPVC